MDSNDPVHDSNIGTIDDSAYHSNIESTNSYISSDLDTEFFATAVSHQDSDSMMESEEEGPMNNGSGVDAHLWGYLQPFNYRAHRVDFWRVSPTVTIGRGPDNVINLPGKKISAQHCVLTWDGSDTDASVTVHDLSINGTFINGNKIGQNETRLLCDGYEISFGSSVPQPENDGVEDYRFIYRHAALPDSQTGINVKYDLTTRELGRGTFGVVRLAVHKKSGEWYAVKTLYDPKKTTQTKLAQEVGIMESLSHRNICRLKESFYCKGNSVSLVLEYVGGGDLRRYTEKQFPNGMPESEVMELVYQICDGMAYVHSKGITHRDLKPENILLTRDVPPLVKVADFGVSKVTTRTTELRSLCGTWGYIAPEIANKRSSYDNRVDSFSIGAIIYYLLTGDHAFENQRQGAQRKIGNVMLRKGNLEKMNVAHISESARDVIRRLLENDPRKRPSMKDVLNHPWFEDYKPYYGPSNWESGPLGEQMETSEPQTPQFKSEGRAKPRAIGKARGRPRSKASIVATTPKKRGYLSPLPEVDNVGNDQDSDPEMKPSTLTPRNERDDLQNLVLRRGLRDRKPSWKILETRMQ